MTEGAVIDRLFGSMYEESLKAEYGFARFAVPWGNKYGADYGRKKVDFSRTLRSFAGRCGVLCRGDEFYAFDGRVYSKVSRRSVEQAYDRLMEALGVSDVMGNKAMRSDVFLSTILSYNRLSPRNDLVAFSNGVVDLREGLRARRRKFSPEYHVTDYHPYAYDPKARCPVWDGFIRTVLPRKRDRDVLQMFLGLGLVQTSDAFGGGGSDDGSPRGTVELCLLLLGGGANGKSVLFNVVCALFGREHVTSLDYDVLTADGDEGMRGRYPIRSAVFNWSSDSDPRRFGKRNTAMFKRIVSGEPVPMRGIRRDIEESKSLPYLIFSLNEPPSVADQSYGFLRRLQFVNFDVTIPRHRQDPNLAYRIIKEDLSGVFNWVMRGAEEIKRRRFHFPETETTRRQLVRTLFELNPVRSWSLAYGLRHEGVTRGEMSEAVRFPVMYDSFRTFCLENGADPQSLLSDRRFANQLLRLGFTRRRSSEGTRYTCYGCGAEGLSKKMFIEDISEPEDYVDEDSVIKDD